MKPEPKGFPQIHPRTRQVNAAGHMIREAINSAAGKHGLTYAELLYILADTLHSYSANGLKAERLMEEENRNWRKENS